jgi:hypothetical protein
VNFLIKVTCNRNDSAGFLNIQHRLFPEWFRKVKKPALIYIRPALADWLTHGEPPELADGQRIPSRSQPVIAHGLRAQW